MRLIEINPKLLTNNPDNPRKTRASAEADAALLANIREIGILQPPVAREQDGKFVLIAGHRRRTAAVAAELPTIHVLIREPGDDAALTGDAESLGSNGDGVRALAENHVRAQLSPVDQWRAVEALVGDNWTEEAIARTLDIPMRRLRALRQLSKTHPKMLAQMARGDMPNDEVLRKIGLATLDEQAAAWKRYAPKKHERTDWRSIAYALDKQRIPFASAKFGEAEAEAFGIVWEDDLFAPANEDGRYTTQGDAFLSAQTAWLEANLPPHGVLLERGDYGAPKLPPKAERIYSNKPSDTDIVGCCVNPRTLEVETVIYRLPEPVVKPTKAKRGSTAPGEPTSPARPSLTEKGRIMVGDLRTEALHMALVEANIPDQTLIGLLVLALGANNVTVQTGASGASSSPSSRTALANNITEGDALTLDPAALRTAAREMLRHTLSCRVGHSSSGMVARYAGLALDAGNYLETTATEAFLTNLSKAAVQSHAVVLGLNPGNTAKATRTVIVREMAGMRYVHPLARFELTDEERTEAAAARIRRVAPNGSGPGDDDDIDGPEGDDERVEQGMEGSAEDDDTVTATDASTLQVVPGVEAQRPNATA